MPGNSSIYTVTLAPTATGSYAANVDGNPYVGIQLLRTTGSQTVEFETLAYSNFSAGDVAGALADHPGGGASTPLSSTLPAYNPYWAVDPQFSGTLMTATPASGSGASSLAWTAGNISSTHVRFQWGSKTGGVFQLALNRKQ